MRLIRAMNYKVIDAMRPHLIADRDYPLDQMANDLKLYMRARPDEFLALTLWEATELRAFILAYIPPGRKHLYIVQAWADDVPKEEAELLFEEAKRFAKEHELSEIRAETIRSPEAFARRWGFETYSTIIAYKLNGEL